MATQLVNLQVQPRTILGKQVKHLRLQGLTPIHLYGRDFSSLALQVDSTRLRRVLVQAGTSRPVSLQIEADGGQHMAFVRNIDFHSLSNDVIHVDFLRVDTSRTVDVEVPLVLEGEAPAVRQLRGVLIRGLSTVHVECLPLEVPAAFVVDISILEDFDKVIRVSDLQVPPEVRVLTDPEQMVASVSAPTVAEEVEGAEVEGAVEAEETSEGQEGGEESDTSS